MRGTWESRQGPGDAWQTEREEEQNPADGNTMLKKRMPLAERRQEVLGGVPRFSAGSSRDNWPDASLRLLPGKGAERTIPVQNAAR
jgi:hypothetical protein